MVVCHCVSLIKWPLVQCVILPSPRISDSKDSDRPPTHNESKKKMDNELSCLHMCNCMILSFYDAAL